MVGVGWSECYRKYMKYTRSLNIKDLVMDGWSPLGAEFLLEHKDGDVSILLLLNKIAKRNGLTEFELPEEYRRGKKKFISRHIRWEVWERDNFTCNHCGSRRYLSIDHITPESKGGTLDLDNLQTLCHQCNAEKGVK